MAVLPLFLLLCVWRVYHVEATSVTLNSLDSSFCHNGLEVIYPEMDIDVCSQVPKGLRKKISTVWNAPQIFFTKAKKEVIVVAQPRVRDIDAETKQGLEPSFDSEGQKLAEMGSIAQAALREQRLDISLILIPSRVHTKAKTYVLVMVDPDAPSRTAPTSAYWRHWLVTNIQGNGLKEGQIEGTTLTDYARPTPPRKSGFHRYQFMLFEQPPQARVTLTEQEKSLRGKWNLQAFVSRFNLGEPVATLQFLTENYQD